MCWSIRTSKLSLPTLHHMHSRPPAPATPASICNWANIPDLVIHKELHQKCEGSEKTPAPTPQTGARSLFTALSEWCEARGASVSWALDWLHSAGASAPVTITSEWRDPFRVLRKSASEIRISTPPTYIPTNLLVEKEKVSRFVGRNGVGNCLL